MNFNYLFGVITNAASIAVIIKIQHKFEKNQKTVFDSDSIVVSVFTRRAMQLFLFNLEECYRFSFLKNVLELNEISNCIITINIWHFCK